MLFAFLLTACPGHPTRKPAPDPVTTCAEGEVLDGETCVPEACGVRFARETAFGIITGDAVVTLDDVGVSDSPPDRHGEWGCGIDVESGASLVATGCTVQRNTALGVEVFGAGAVVVLVDTQVRDTAPGPDGDYGRGVEVEAGASLTAVGCVFQGNTDAGVYADGVGTVVDLVDTEILDTAPSLADGFGRGVSAQNGAAVTATRCTVQGNTDAGVVAYNAGTVVDLVDTEILETAPNPGGSNGFGAGVADGASLTATGCTVQGSTSSGVVADDAGTAVSLVNTQILDTAPGPDGSGGFGVAALDGASLTATGCTVQRNTEGGVVAFDPETVVDLVDTEVLDTVSTPDGSSGFGVQVGIGASLTATGCTVRGNTKVGVFVLNVGTAVELVDTEILDTVSGPEGTDGVGIEVIDGAALTANGCTVRGNTGIGVVAGNFGTVVELVDTGILDTAPSPDGGFGRGVTVQEGARLTATRCTVQGNTDTGVFAASFGTVVGLVDTTILDTRRGRIGCFAAGVSAEYGASVEGTDSDISGTEGPGVYISSGSWVSLDGTQITENTAAGAIILDGTLALTASTITNTLPDAEWGGGFGVYGTDHFGPPTLTVLDSTIGPHAYAAIWLDGDGTYDIEHNSLSGSPGVDQHGNTIHGNGLFAEHGVTAWHGRTGLLLVDNTFSDASEIGVLLDGSSAELDGNSWFGNGTDIRQQLCDGDDGTPGTIDDVAHLTDDDLLGAPGALVCPVGNVLTAYDMEFSTLYLPEVETEE